MILRIIFGMKKASAKGASSEAMLVKDKKGHMVLLADQIEGVVEAGEEYIETLSPVFGQSSCSYFPKVL